MKISVVIPCYRSADSIGDVIQRTENTIKRDGRFDYEFICVNDCSPDHTMDVLRQIASNDCQVKLIDLTKNFGQHSALMAGFNNVSGDIIVSMDDDGQSRPEDLFKLVDKLLEGYDLVSAKFIQENRSLFRRFGSKVSMGMSHKLVGMPDGIELNSYCVFKRFVADEIIKYKNAYPFVHGLMLRVTRNIANVNLERPNRESGTSGYTFNKLFSLWMNGFTAFSEKPLQIASILGVVTTIVGLLILIIEAILGLISNSGSVVAILSAIMLVLCGVILMCVGLLGEYVGRIYICINNAPQYTIREKINF